MGKLIIKLDIPIQYCLIENFQLLYASELPSDDISKLLDKIGDYKIDEVAVYMKFDTRQDVEGVRVDRIVSDYIDYVFKVSQSDYDGLKAIAMRFGAQKLSFYSAYRHYATILSDGVVADSYIDHNYIIAGIQDGKYHSLKICSAERLQRTIESCQMSNITYAQHSAIPEIKNIELIPTEYHETFAFLQFVLYSEPCYTVDIDSGEVFEYGDQSVKSKHYILNPEETVVAIESIRKNLEPKKIVRKRTFSIAEVKIMILYVIAGLIAAIGVYGFTKLPSDRIALETRVDEQSITMKRLGIEEQYLSDSINNYDEVSFYRRLEMLNSTLNQGAIMSTRFYFDGIEITLFVTDDAMKDMAISELESYYTVDSCVYEKDVNNATSTAVYKQYNIIVKFPED